MKKICRYGVLSVVAALLLMSSLAALSQAAELCVKKRVTLTRAGAVKLSKALILTEGACPEGFVVLNKTAGALSLQGPQGPAGPTITAANIYVPGSAGVPWDDLSDSTLVIDPQSSGEVLLHSRSGGGVGYFYIPIPIATVLTGANLYVKEVSFTYHVSQAASYISEVSVAKIKSTTNSVTMYASGANLNSTTTATVTLPIAPGDDSLIDGSVQVRFALLFADSTDAIHISHVRVNVGEY